MVRASEEVKAPAKAAKERQRGISVLERLREQERIEAEKDAAKRPGKVRSQSQPPKDTNGGEGERGRGRQRINESGLRADGGVDVMQLQRCSRSADVKEELAAECAGELCWACRRRGDQRLP